MTTSLIVWDQKTDPLASQGEVWCWRSYTHGDRVSSVPRYLEDHAERFRARYLAFIHDLGESQIDHKRIVDHLDLGDGFSFWWMNQVAEKNPFKSPRIYDCLRLLALEEILLDRKPSDLTLYSADQDLAQALRRLCRNLQITFVWHPGERSKHKWSLRRLYRGLPHTLQGLISLRHLVSRWPLRGLEKPQWFSGDGAIFLCSYFIHLDPASCAQGRFYSRHWEVLPKHLHDSGRRTNWVQHFLFSSVVPDVQTGLSWLRRFNRDSGKQGCHAFLDTYLTWEIVVRAMRHWLWLNAVGWRLRNIQSAFYAKGSAAWLWPILRRDWVTSLNGPIGLSNCLWVALFDAVLKDMPQQRVGLYLCENQGWERALLRAWRKYEHGEIIGVPHSTASFWHLDYFDDPRSVSSEQSCGMPLPDRLAVNGMAAWRAFVETGYSAEKLAAVEALRYLNLSARVARPARNPAQRYSERPPVCESHGVKVLVLGDIIPASMHNFLVLLEKAVKLLPPEYRFTFKSHPGYAVDLAHYPGLQMDETTEALDRILNEYDFAVAANSTSASVDAYVAGLPVIIGLDGGDLNLCPLRGQPGVRFVSTPGELAEALQPRGRSRAVNSDQHEFFFLDQELPRWKQLLGLSAVGNS